MAFAPPHYSFLDHAYKFSADSRPHFLEKFSHQAVWSWRLMWFHLCGRRREFRKCDGFAKFCLHGPRQEVLRMAQDRLLCREHFGCEGSARVQGGKKKS